MTRVHPIETNALPLSRGLSGDQLFAIGSVGALALLALIRLYMVGEYDGVTITHEGSSTIVGSEPTSLGEPPDEDAPDCPNPDGHFMKHTTTYNFERKIRTAHWYCIYCPYNYTIVG